MQSNYNKSPGQILLRWVLLQGIAVLPMSSNPQRILENCELDFELSAEDNAALNQLDRNQPSAWGTTNNTLMAD